MKFRIPIFWSSLAFLAGSYLALKFAIRPPLSSFVLSMYVGLILVALVVHVTLEEERIREFFQPARDLFLDDGKRIRQALVLTGFPLLVGLWAAATFGPRSAPPAELRTIHPALPDAFVGLTNPLREDRENLTGLVQEGAAIYFRNCFFCHGDALNGKGHFAEGINPPPADFTDQGTIAQLQESYVFWRVTTGGPGLPGESQPWNSAMPVWKDILTEEEIWKVILYIYEGAGVEPRTWD